MKWDEDEVWPEYRNFVGFYWTLPLPSCGFNKLPDNPDEAAKISRTIRYQREVVRNHVAKHNGDLKSEIVFLEVRPDRGTDFVQPYIEKALRACIKYDAQLLYVEFAHRHGWRDHPVLRELMQLSRVSCLPLYPDPIHIDGVEFDPIEHFRTVRAAQNDLMANKEQRRAAIATIIDDVYAELTTQTSKPTFGDVSDRLNNRHIVTITGRSWTAANLKQFMISIQNDLYLKPKKARKKEINNASPAYQAGLSAHQAGMNRGSNPFCGADRDLWFKGWDDDLNGHYLKHTAEPNS